MFGLAVLLAFGLYLLISVIVVRSAVGYARRNGKSTKRWGWSAALLMYLLVFWDWIPTVVMHQYYCATEAGFWIYKTPEQWKKENPRVMETLVENNNSPRGISPDWPGEQWPDMKVAHINQRFGMAYKNHLSSKHERELFIHVWRWKVELLDKETGEILAQQVDFSTGNGYVGGAFFSLKFWLQSEHCVSAKEKSNEFREFVEQFRGEKR
jgi:hypothetical protein